MQPVMKILVSQMGSKSTTHSPENLFFMTHFPHEPLIRVFSELFLASLKKIPASFCIDPHASVYRNTYVPCLPFPLFSLLLSFLLNFLLSCHPPLGRILDKFHCLQWLAMYNSIRILDKFHCLQWFAMYNSIRILDKFHCLQWLAMYNSIRILDKCHCLQWLAMYNWIRILDKCHCLQCLAMYNCLRNQGS